MLVGGDFEKIADAAVKDAKKPNEIAKAAYDYTVSTMKYDKPADKVGWGNGSTQWACDAHYGNCSDFHALVMSIGRTKGVPVKLEIGFALPAPDANKPETKGGPVGGYHCWAKLYLGGVGFTPRRCVRSTEKSQPGAVLFWALESQPRSNLPMAGTSIWRRSRPANR